MRDIYRIIDANCNRAVEAVRVCEDILRFLRERPEDALKLKNIRHSIAENVISLAESYRDIVLARDVERDSGKDKAVFLSGGTGIGDIFYSNMRRACEALRVLEEVVKVFERESSFKFQKIRFELYALEHKIISDMDL